MTGHKKMGAQALLAYGNAHLEQSSSEQSGPGTVQFEQKGPESHMLKPLESKGMVARTPSPGGNLLSSLLRVDRAQVDAPSPCGRNLGCGQLVRISLNTKVLSAFQSVVVDTLRV